MKKHLKAVISMLLSLVLLVSAIPAGTVTASAEAKLSSKVTYETDGTAIVTLTAGDFYNAVRYTTDGTVPTADSKMYVKPIEITSETLIRAAEFDGDKKVKGIKLTVAPKDAVSAPTTDTATTTATEKTGKITFDVTQLGNFKAIVELECETPDVEIRYTTDGTKPDQNSELYENGIIITEKTKIRARAYKTGYKTTTTYAKTASVKRFADIPDDYVANQEETKTEEKVEEKTEAETKTETKTEEKTETNTEKTIVVEKDKEESSVKEKIDYKFTYMDDIQKTYVTLIKSKTSNVIRYTTDGSAVSKSSKKYSKRVGFTEPGVFRAKEYTKNGELVATLSIKVKMKCAPVELVCTDISLGIKQIDFRCDTEGATIYYTTDGIIPTAENAEIYDGNPVFLSEDMTLTAVAMKDGYVKSGFTRSTVAAVPYVVQNLDYDRPEITEVVDAVNALRVANGLSALEADKNTVMIANVRAKEISLRASHDRPNGGTYRSAFTERDIIVVDSSEFFASTCKSADQFISLLKQNAKEQIITPYSNYDSIGVGYYEKANKKYWVLILAGSTN